MATKLGYYTSVFHGAKALLESHHVGMDMIMCLLGPEISNGLYRAVYEHALDSTKVIKVEYGYERREAHDSISQNSFCNVQEFLLWREIEGLTGNLEWVKNWFAPIHWISPGGHIMCMEKTHPLPDKDRPNEIPRFMSDVKQANFGWIGDKFVCHDYAHINVLTTYSKKMRTLKDVWD